LLFFLLKYARIKFKQKHETIIIIKVPNSNNPFNPSEISNSAIADSITAAAIEQRRIDRRAGRLNFLEIDINAS